MDIDRFKVINDLYGLKEGDKLLIAIADLLRERWPGPQRLRAPRGDVFCLCVDYSRERILALIKELTDSSPTTPCRTRSCLRSHLRGRQHRHAINVLCDWANLALKTIKGNYLNSYAFYDGKLRERILEERRSKTRCTTPFCRGNSFCTFSKVHIPTSRIIGSEGWCAGYTPPRADAAGPFHPLVREERLHHPAG